MARRAALDPLNHHAQTVKRGGVRLHPPVGMPALPSGVTFGAADAAPPSGVVGAMADAARGGAGDAYGVAVKSRRRAGGPTERMAPRSRVAVVAAGNRRIARERGAVARNAAVDAVARHTRAVKIGGARRVPRDGVSGDFDRRPTLGATGGYDERRGNAPRAQPSSE